MQRRRLPEQLQRRTGMPQRPGGTRTLQGPSTSSLRPWVSSRQPSPATLNYCLPLRPDCLAFLAQEPASGPHCVSPQEEADCVKLRTNALPRLFNLEECCCCRRRVQPRQSTCAEGRAQEGIQPHEQGGDKNDEVRSG